ncbi:MAG: hypothetical protein CFE23_16070 [Flavobacterium sp. BFFFF1]|nr:MAG: hypothetical protein CFE23_16070 [Flavobacterium sp. BFFFF1]
MNRKLELENGRKDSTLNAYQIGFTGFKEFEFRYFKDSFFYVSLSFAFIIFLSLGILYLAFKENYRFIFRISVFNLILLFSSILIIIIGDFIDDFNQIRYGYYLLALNIFALILVSRKLVKT